jgi:hypothetical protein
MLTPQAGIQVDKFYPNTDWQYSFPDGYTRLEYLQSSGTQYIDTGVTPNVNTTFRLNAEFTGTGVSIQNETLLWSVDINVEGKLGFFWPGRGTNCFLQYGNSSVSLPTIFEENKSFILETKIENDKYNFYKDNSLVHSFDLYNSFSSSTHIPLFACLYKLNSNVAYNGIGRVYSCQIYDNGTLVRNFVPAKRNSDGVLGMYDLVNNVFYTNANTSNTTPFIAGPELYQNNSQIDIRQKNNTNFVEKYKFNENNELIWANPQLNLSGPVGYTKVGNPTIENGVASNFISSNYLKIDQNYNVTNTMNTEIYFRAKTPSTISSGFNFIYTNTQGYPTYFFLGTYGSVLFTARMGLQNGVGLKFSDLYISVQTDTWYRFKITGNNGIWKFEIFDDNGNLLKTDTKDWTNNIINANYNFRLQCIDNTNTYSGSIDLKETYIKVNDKLWFYGKNYTSENYAPVPAGLNYNNTTTPSIGYVNTQTQVFTPAPEGVKFKEQRDLTVTPPEDNTITLLYGVKSDFSKYALFGLLADTSSGTYDVYIDDVLYATTASGTQTDIDFDPSSANYIGDEYVPIGTCTTPEALVLHKVVIKPTTSGATITRFKSIRTSGVTSKQVQGCLWCHFELENVINVTDCFGSYNTKRNPNMMFITAKGDELRISSFVQFLSGSADLYADGGRIAYLPTINLSGLSLAGNGVFGNSNSGVGTIKRIKLKNGVITSATGFVYNNTKLEKIDICNVDIEGALSNAFRNTNNLKIIPKIKYNSTSYTDFLTSDRSLLPTKLDVSSVTSLNKIGTYGSSTYPMRGLRGLKVSNEAPFSGSSPQINVSYTGLDRDALVELFESMPGYMKLDKVGEPTIDSNGVASGFSSSNYLQLQNNLTLSNDMELEINIRFKTPSELGTTNQYLFGANASDYSGYIGISYKASTGQFETRLPNITGGSYTTYTMTANTYYSVKSVVKNNTVQTLLYDANNVLLAQTTVKTFSTNWSYSTQLLTLGVKTDIINSQVLGSIDLKNSYITINNARYQFQLPDDATTRAINITAATGNNLTKVGSPTIDENGVASGFSSSDYLQSNTTFSMSNNFEFLIKFKFNIKSNNTEYIYSGPFCLLLNNANILIRFKENNVGTNHTIVSSLSTDTFYWLKIKKNNNIIELLLSTNGIDYTQLKNIDLINIIVTNLYQIQIFGKIGSSDDFHFNGSIDLNNTYIKVGNNYIMKGYLTDNDRLIATNKGWGITG